MRERLNARKFDLLFSEWQESGLPVKDFCENLGMSRQNWYKWCKKLNKLNYAHEAVTEFISINIPDQSERDKSIDAHIFEVAQKTTDQSHKGDSVHPISDLADSKQNLSFYGKSSPMFNEGRMIANEDSCAPIDRKVAMPPSASSPIEFVFPNGTKMVLRGSIDFDLLKKIVHLYD